MKELNMTLLTEDIDKYYSGTQEPIIIPKDFEITEIKSTLSKIIETLKNNGYEIMNNISDSPRSNLILSTNFISSSMHRET
jgi:hypothetical protein